MRAQIANISIAGIASALPPDIFKICSLAALYGEKQVKRIIASTGIEEVRLADAATTASDLCVCAAQCLLERLKVDKSSIDAVVFLSQTPDYKAPATSCLLQYRLGLKKDVAAFDINYGCSAYIYGLYQAGMLIAAGGCSRVLVCAGSTESKLINPKDRALKAVIGDAGTATLLEKGSKEMKVIVKTDGAGYGHLIVPAGGARLPNSPATAVEQEDVYGNIKSKDNLHMNGLQIMNFALEEVPRLVGEILDFAAWGANEAGIYAFHQPNKLILDHLQDMMNIPGGKMPVDLQTVGNTGAASIPLLLSRCFAYGKNGGALSKTVACGFGTGLSWGAAALDLSETQIFPPVDYGKK